MTEFARELGPLKRALTRAARAAAHLPEIPEAQIEVLRLLEAKSFNTNELAAALHLARSTVSNLLSAMQKGDLVELLRQSSDKRIVSVVVTPHARELLATYDAQVERTFAAALEQLTMPERQAIANAGPIMARLVKLLQNWG
jgi:DNA-binding MarR family transcriptional regulator